MIIMLGNIYISNEQHQLLDMLKLFLSFYRAISLQIKLLDITRHKNVFFCSRKTDTSKSKKSYVNKSPLEQVKLEQKVIYC